MQPSAADPWGKHSNVNEPLGFAVFPPAAAAVKKVLFLCLKNTEDYRLKGERKKETARGGI